MPTAVILADEEDVHGRSVAWEVAALGGRSVTLDTAHFPTRWRLSLSVRDPTDFELILPDGERIPGEDVSGIWWRRVGTHVIPDDVENGEHREFCRSESRSLIEGWVYGFGQRAINPLAAEIPARRKPYQLMMASRLGLPIPATLVTNDPTTAASFDAAHEKGTIYKVLTGTSFQFTETRLIGDSERATFDLLKFAPVIFQERIEGGPDIRATLVDGKVFAGALQANHPEAWIDWRLDLAIQPEPHKLPADVEARLVAYQQALGLRYGAYDLRRDHSGNYVFFEVNPSGQFLFLEIHAALPIGRAIAEGLLGLSGPEPVTSIRAESAQQK